MIHKEIFNRLFRAIKSKDSEGLRSLYLDCQTNGTGDIFRRELDRYQRVNLECYRWAKAELGHLTSQLQSHSR
jgi:hypothetical protein